MNYEATRNENGYSTEAFVNTILSFSFKEHFYMSRATLNKIAYLTVDEYYRTTGKQIIEEKFSFTNYEPSLRTVNSGYHRSFETNCVQHYLNDDLEKVYLIADPEFLNIAKKVWNENKAASLISFKDKIEEIQKRNFDMAG